MPCLKHMLRFLFQIVCITFIGLRTQENLLKKILLQMVLIENLFLPPICIYNCALKMFHNISFFWYETIYLSEYLKTNVSAIHGLILINYSRFYFSLYNTHLIKTFLLNKYLNIEKETSSKYFD